MIPIPEVLGAVQIVQIMKCKKEVQKLKTCK